MVVVTKNGSWKHDNGVMHPVTSLTLGGAYVDRDIRDIMVGLMTDVGIPLAKAMMKAADICESTEFFKAKQWQNDLVVDISALGPRERAATGEMEIEKGILTIYR
jgi:hypothetical protein